MTRAHARAASLVLALGVALVALATPRDACAHLMPPQEGTLNVVGDSVFEVLSLPASSLVAAHADDDGDGRLSPAEVSAHEPALRDEIARRFRIEDGGVRGRLELVMVNAEHDERVDDPAESRAGATHVLVLMKTRFASPPRALRVETDLFGAREGEGSLRLRATRGDAKDTFTLAPSTPSHALFRADGEPLGKAPGWEPALGRAPWAAAAVAIVLTLAVAALRRRRARRSSVTLASPSPT